MATRYGAACAALGAAPAAAAWGGFLRRRPAGPHVEAAKDHIDFFDGKDLVTTYHIGPDAAKPYFWPLNAPDGADVTRDWPMEKAKPGEQTDHVHQKSGWFTHGDVIPEGIELKHKTKTVPGRRFLVGGGRARRHRLRQGERSPAVQGTNRRRHGQRMADGRRRQDSGREAGDFLLRPRPRAGRARWLVVDSDLYADVCPITFGDTKEGSFGVRVRTDLTEEKGKGVITNADGKKGEKGDDGGRGRVSAWCDYSGPIDGKAVGVAILADPSNPYPAAGTRAATA